MSITRWLTPVALTSALVMGACKKSDSAQLAQDSTAYARDLQMANHDSAAQPALNDAPPAPAAAPAAAPAPCGARLRPPPTPRSSRTRPRARPLRGAATATTTASGNTVVHGRRLAARRQSERSRVAPSIDLTSTRSRLHEHEQGRRQVHGNGESADHGQQWRGDSVGREGGDRGLAAQAERQDGRSDPDDLRRADSSRGATRRYPIDATIDHVDVDKVRNASTKSDAAKVGGGAVDRRHHRPDHRAQHEGRGDRRGDGCSGGNCGRDGHGGLRRLRAGRWQHQDPPERSGADPERVAAKITRPHACARAFFGRSRACQSHAPDGSQ